MTDQQASQEQAAATPPDKDGVLRLIGALMLLEGLLVLAMAIGALKLLHHDVAALAAEWIAAIRIDLHNELIDFLLAKLGFLNDHRLKQISAGSFVYAALKLTEAGGLLRGKRWAEYFTVIATGALIPLEIYELIHRSSWLKAVVLVVNVAIVWYLILNLHRTRRQGPMV